MYLCIKDCPLVLVHSEFCQNIVMSPCFERKFGVGGPCDLLPNWSPTSCRANIISQRRGIGIRRRRGIGRHFEVDSDDKLLTL